MKGLKGKVAVVTGGGGAIGGAICQRLAEDGVFVGVADLNPDAAQSVVDGIIAAGGQAVPLVVDITDHAAVKQGVEAFEAAHGPISVLVNNAGWDRVMNFLSTEPDLWSKVIAINFTGALNMHHAILPGMAARGFGRVINVASDAGRVGSSGEAVYAGAKGGLIAFGKTVARELASKGITVNAVCPGPTDTPLFWSAMATPEIGEKVAEGLKRAIPLRRLGQPDDLAGVIAFLASDEAAFITGQTVSVSGGLTMHG